MASQLIYDGSVARSSVTQQRITEVEEKLLQARDVVFEDVELFNSNGIVPEDKQPLDAGFIEFPSRLLKDIEAKTDGGLVGQIERVAAELRDNIDRLVVLGIGGSYMGMRALFEALCSPVHNELSRSQRGGVPRLYFEGNNVDNDSVQALLNLLETSCRDKSDVEQRWGISVISKSGGTLETAVAFRIFRKALEGYYGPDSSDSRRFVVPITGEIGKLRNLSNTTEYPEVFPIPDGIGGRFSVLTAVGLFPAAVLGIDIRQLLRGAADITESFRTQPPGTNPVLDYTATCHALEVDQGANIRVLTTWGKRLEAFGLWYDQLLSESLGKQGQGATPLTVVNTRDLHSRGQQHQQGKGDKLFTNIVVESPAYDVQTVPESNRDEDDLNQIAGKGLPEILAAATKGTNEAYHEDGRPTADIVIPQLDAYYLGQLLQMMMLTTVVEGRLININPYGQPGVEMYKTNMKRILGID